MAPTTTDSKKLASIHYLRDVGRLARRKLPRPIFGYIDHVAEDGRTQRANLTAFDEYCFLPKVFVNVSHIDLQTELHGKCYAVPFGIAHMGISALSAYQGDLVLARAAVCNLPMIMSGSSCRRTMMLMATGSVLNLVSSYALNVF